MSKPQQKAPVKMAAVPTTNYERMKRHRSVTFAKIQYNRTRADGDPTWHQLTTGQRSSLTARAHMEACACLAAEEKAIRKALEGVVDGGTLYKILKRDGYWG